MKHHSTIKKLGRLKGPREALMRSLANSLIAEEKITTTLTKAKALRPQIEKIITLAKVDSPQARTLVNSRLGSGADIKKLFTLIAPRFKERPGGYTRIIKLPPRLGDGSPMALIEFIS